MPIRPLPGRTSFWLYWNRSFLSTTTMHIYPAFNQTLLRTQDNLIEHAHGTGQTRQPSKEE